MTTARRLVLAALLVAFDVAGAAIVILAAPDRPAAAEGAAAMLAAVLALRLFDPAATPRGLTVLTGRVLAALFGLAVAGFAGHFAPGLAALALIGWAARATLFAIAARVPSGVLAEPTRPEWRHELRLALRAMPWAGLTMAPAGALPPPPPASRTWRVCVWDCGGRRRRLAPREGPGRGCSLRTKRALDLALALPAGLLALAPLLVLAALLRWRQGPPVLYAQVRWTLDRRPFAILKFRSMRPDAEAPETPAWPRRDDDRATGWGGLMRRLWIDEMPQIWNVLRGDLALVGPRPERPVFAEWFLERLPIYRKRYEAPAGVTGLAQVAGYVGNTSLRRRAACDALYVRRWSPLLDLGLLVATLAGFVRRPRRPTFDFAPGGDAPIP